MNTEQQKELMQEIFPFVEYMGKMLPGVIQTRESIRSLVHDGDAERLMDIGFPEDIIPILSLWKDAPEVLVSTTHSEEMDVYPYISFINLALLKKRLALEGENLGNVQVIYFDTVPVHTSARDPFRFGRFGAKIGSRYDMFGILGRKVTSRTPLSKEELLQYSQQFNETIPEIAAQLSSELADEMRNQMRSRVLTNKEGLQTFMTKEERNQALGKVRNLIDTRLYKLAEVYADVVSEVGENISLAKFLMLFEQRFAGMLFTSATSRLGYEGKFGYDSVLLSDADDYRKRIKASVGILLESRGVDLLRGCLESGESVALCGGKNNEQHVILLNDEMNFMIRTPDGDCIIPDEEVVPLLMSPDTILHAKVESIGLVAGALMTHMGSEYGIREKIVQQLGLQGVARDFALNNRIGQDKEQGSDGMILQSNKAYISLILMYTLFGDAGVRKLVGRKAGKTNKADEYSDEGSFKAVAAQSLLHDIGIL